MYFEKIHNILFEELINQDSLTKIIDWIHSHSYWFLINQTIKN
jgi:hypothetical protein